MIKQVLILLVFTFLIAGCGAPDQEILDDSVEPTAMIADEPIQDIPIEEPDPVAEVIEKSCPDSCEDDNACTEDVCSDETNFECVHTEIVPCCGDGVCDEEEECEEDCKTEIDTELIFVNISNLFGDIDYYELGGVFKKLFFEIENTNDVPVVIEQINLKVQNVKGDQYDKKQEIYSHTITEKINVNSHALIYFESEIEPMVLELKSPKNVLEKFDIEIELELQSGDVIKKTETLLLDDFYFYTHLFHGGSGTTYYNDLSFWPLSHEYRGYLQGSSLVASQINQDNWITGLGIPVSTGSLILEFKEDWVETEKEVDGKTRTYITSFPLEFRTNNLESLPSFDNLVLDLFLFSHDNRYFYSFSSEDLATLEFKTEGLTSRATLNLTTDFKKTFTTYTNILVSYAELREKNHLEKVATAYRREVMRDTDD